MIGFWTRDEYHLKKWKEMYTKENCPFCTNIKEEEKYLWKWKKWFIVHNIYPYSWNNKHIMALPYTHKKFFIELDDEELLELREVNKFIKDFFWEENYFSCLRETIAWRSVEHLHIHYVPWKLQGKYLRKMLMDQGFPIKEKL